VSLNKPAVFFELLADPARNDGELLVSSGSFKASRGSLWVRTSSSLRQTWQFHQLALHLEAQLVSESMRAHPADRAVRSAATPQGPQDRDLPRFAGYSGIFMRRNRSW
jgi:hypothetical protein